MYINDVNLFVYIAIGLLGGCLGFFVGWCNERLPEYKKVFSKDIFFEYKTRLKPPYILMLINAILYIVILYFNGLNSGFVENIDLIKYLILTPMLLSAFVIDYRLTIIPNRLNLTMFEIGLIFIFILGSLNFSLAIDSIFGMLIGGGIFLIINLIGGLIAGKEAMGMGDVKLMGALGLYFGLINTMVITVLAFLIGAIISVVILIKKKKEDEGYIPFGPFIVIATFITMIVPSAILINVLLEIFSLGLFRL